jgi:hypothetical protein
MRLVAISNVQSQARKLQLPLPAKRRKTNSGSILPKVYRQNNFECSPLSHLAGNLNCAAMFFDNAI